MRNNVNSILEKIARKARATAPLAARCPTLPYSGDGKTWRPAPFDGNSWWTGGFWPGALWLLYTVTGDEAFRAEALRGEDLLTAEFRAFNRLNHDVGFMYLLSCGANYRLTGSAQARTDCLHAASLLMGRFNPVGFIRAWNEPERVGYAIIDCMMNLSLLFWATAETGDPRFAHVAKVHADTTLRDFLRPDGSVAHIVEFDPETGAKVREHAGQGYALGSAWSRGQAWGLYGFAMAYANTGDKRYLDAAKAIADFFIAHIRPDGLTDCDFLQPKESRRLDNIAGACGASGLLELHRLTGENRYREAAERLVDGLIDRCCDLDAASCGLLTHCTASYHDDAAGVHINIVYGDFFLIEALLKLSGRDAKLWYSREASAL